MFGASPIESWEGATVVFNHADSGLLYVYLLNAVALCVGTIIGSIRTENKAEALANEHMEKQRKAAG